MAGKTPAISALFQLAATSGVCTKQKDLTIRNSKIPAIVIIRNYLQIGKWDWHEFPYIKQNSVDYK